MKLHFLQASKLEVFPQKKAHRFCWSIVTATMSARVTVTNIVNSCHKTVHCTLKFEGTHPIQLSNAGARKQNTDATPNLNTNILSPTNPPPPREILGIIALTALARTFTCLTSVSVMVGSL